MKAKRALSLAITATLLSGMLFTCPMTAQAVSSSDFLKTNGQDIRSNYGSGPVVNLHGTNLGSWNLMEGWMCPEGEAALDRSGWTAYGGPTGDGSSPSNAIDNSADTRWTTGEAQTNSDWFKIDMGSTQYFDEITIDAGSNTGDYPATYLVQGSTDGSTWTDIANGSGTSHKLDLKIGGNGATARYILVLQQGSKGNWWSISDFNVYVSDMYDVYGKLTSRFGTTAADNLLKTYQDAWIQGSDLDNIKNMGLNFVRVPLYWETFLNRDGTWKANPYGQLDQLISQCAQRGLYVLIDLHGVPGCDDGWQSGGWLGHNDFWWNTNYQNWVISIWQGLATHYNGNPTVCGYDLINEPVSNNPNLTNSQFYNTLYNTVRAIDTDHIIFMEAFYDFNSIASPSTYGWTNVVYETHPYDMQNYTSWSSQFSSLTSALNTLKNYKTTWNVPVYAGEYCWYSFNDLWETWLSALDANGIQWSNWAYKNRRDSTDYQNGGNWGFYNSCTLDIPDINNDSYDTIAYKWSRFTTNNFNTNTNLINVVKGQSATPTQLYTIKSSANGDYVCADNYGNDPLIANRATASTWENYYIYHNADGTVSLLSAYNHKFVCVDPNNSFKLIAESSGINSYEKFAEVNMGNNTVALKSIENGDYVCADGNNGYVLYANRTTASTWETFTIAGA